MAEKKTNNAELSDEQTTQKKKTTSNKKSEAEIPETQKPKAKKKADATVSDETTLRETAETATEEIAEEAVETAAEEIAEEAAETAAEEIAEEVAETAAEEIAEEVAETAAEEIAEEAAENSSQEKTEEASDITVLEESKEDALPSPTMDIEHFSDYKSTIEQTPEEAVEEIEVQEQAAHKLESPDEQLQDSPNEENLPDAEDYENLTILDHGLFKEAIPITSKTAAPDRISAKKEAKYEDPDSKKYDPQKPRRVDGRFEFIELFVFTLVAVMLITTFLFRHSVVEGESMENTLFANEHLIITDVFYKPKAGDIIVFEDYSTGYTTAIVKRVIATEGQTVRIAKEGVYVDGVFLDNEYYVQIDTENYSYLANVDSRFTTDYTIPEGEVFVLGDHRDHSSDSRTFGTISEETILGKVILRFYPFDKFGSVYKEG